MKKLRYVESGRKIPDKVKYNQFQKPNVPKQGLTEKVIKIMPPKELGPPSPNDCEIIVCTPLAKKLMLEREHYDAEGVYIDYNERSRYLSDTPINYNGNTSDEIIKTNFDDLSDNEYKSLHARVSDYLIENNFSTKTLLKGLTVEDMVEKYRIPNEIIKPQ